MPDDLKPPEELGVAVVQEDTDPSSPWGRAKVARQAMFVMAQLQHDAIRCILDGNREGAEAMMEEIQARLTAMREMLG